MDNSIMVGELTVREAELQGVPVLVRLALPIPRSPGSKIDSVDNPGDTDSDAGGWAAFGANYCAATGVWLRGRGALVLDSSFVLGTKTVTEGREEVDEDEG